MEKVRSLDLICDHYWQGGAYIVELYDEDFYEKIRFYKDGFCYFPYSKVPIKPELYLWEGENMQGQICLSFFGKKREENITGDELHQFMNEVGFVLGSDTTLTKLYLEEEWDWHSLHIGVKDVDKRIVTSDEFSRSNKKGMVAVRDHKESLHNQEKPSWNLARSYP